MRRSIRANLFLMVMVHLFGLARAVKSGTAGRAPPFVAAARTIAKTPARIAGGRFGHADTTTSRSGSAGCCEPDFGFSASDSASRGEVHVFSPQ